MVVVVATELMSMLEAACLAGGAMVLARCLRVSQAKRAIDWGVLVGIGAGLGIGTAMDRSGAAALVAGGLVGAVGTNPTALLAAIYGLTTVMANLITTKAAAVLIFPIALATAAELDVSFMPFAITLIFAAASAYATPIGYQTNLMVYGPGGYRSIDFLRIGAPLSVLVWLMTLLIVPHVWPF
jgi:di/tricarboxylate transporter